MYTPVLQCGTAPCTDRPYIRLSGFKIRLVKDIYLDRFFCMFRIFSYISRGEWTSQCVRQVRCHGDGETLRSAEGIVSWIYITLQKVSESDEPRERVVRSADSPHGWTPAEGPVNSAPGLKTRTNASSSLINVSMCESRAVPSGKVYRQLFDAQVGQRSDGGMKRDLNQNRAPRVQVFSPLWLARLGYC